MFTFVKEEFSCLITNTDDSYHKNIAGPVDLVKLDDEQVFIVKDGFSLTLPIADIDTIDGAPAAGNVDDVIAQLRLAFPDGTIQDLKSVLNVDNDADGQKITGLADPEADQDAATKKYVDDNAGSGGGTLQQVADAGNETTTPLLYKGPMYPITYISTDGDNISGFTCTQDLIDLLTGHETERYDFAVNGVYNQQGVLNSIDGLIAYFDQFDNDVDPAINGVLFTAVFDSEDTLVTKKYVNNVAVNPINSLQSNVTSLTETVNNLNNELIFFPTPGINWLNRNNSAADDQWSAVCFGNGIFVAVSLDGTIMTSPDGNVWTLRTAPNAYLWKAICFGNNLFVAVSNNAVSDQIMTSPDGINWTARTTPEANDWTGVAFGNNLFVAVAQIALTKQVMTSPDGINWTLRTAANTNHWTSVCYGAGLFVAVANSGVVNQIMTSPDGINWTGRAGLGLSTAWISVCFGNGVFVAVSYGGDYYAMYSFDGITWVASILGAAALAIAYGAGLFVAVYSSAIRISRDAVNWLSQITNANGLNLRGICYGNGLFVVVSENGIGNRVFISGYLLS